MTARSSHDRHHTSWPTPGPAMTIPPARRLGSRAIRRDRMTGSSEQTFVLKPGAVPLPEPPALTVGHYLVTGKVEAQRRDWMPVPVISFGRRNLL